MIAEVLTAITILISLFNKFSFMEDDRNELSMGEFKLLLQKEPLDPNLIRDDPKNVDKIFKRADVNGDGQVDYDEYVQFLIVCAEDYYNSYKKPFGKS
ncbi:protein S100-G-like [Pseudophryne corroboree]|uniref:protein S100-G-like n=1 Tax=Pseudophryne corroboree TaxID=495146 RepID=UPI0030820B93